MIKTILLFHIIAFVLGFFLDLLIGDPHWIYHPVRLIGLLIGLCEKIFLGKTESGLKGENNSGKTETKKSDSVEKKENFKTDNTKVFFGILTVIIVLSITLIIITSIVFWAYYFNIYLAQKKMQEAKFFQEVQAIVITSPTTHARPVKLWFSEDED